MGIGSMGGTYFNFILGTGSEEVGKVIKDQIKNRKANKQSYMRALYSGTKDGIVQSHKTQIANGGFWQSLKKGFGEIPAGWKNGKGIKKLTGALKGCGKAMPALMAGLAVLAEVPNVYKAVKEKGAVQGLKEVGKTAARLTTGALCAAIGSAILPVGGTIVGWMVGDWIGSKIVGKSYSEQKAEAEEKANQAEQTAANSTNNLSSVATGSVEPLTTSAGSTGISLPHVDADDFGPYKPYSNIFYNYPQAYMDMGASMPKGTGMYPTMGYNNISGNLLDKVNNGGNLLTPIGPQSAYNRLNSNAANPGNKLNIEK